MSGHTLTCTRLCLDSHKTARSALAAVAMETGGDGPRERLQVNERETEGETERGVSLEVTVYFENDRFGKEATRAELSSFFQSVDKLMTSQRMF